MAGKRDTVSCWFGFSRYVTDTVDWHIPESDYKVLIYVDSIGCTSCKLQLYNVEALAEELPESMKGSLYGNEEGTIFCCCPGSNGCAASACGGC